MEKEAEVRFEYANDITGEKVHILDVIEERERTKDKKKYYCTGCTAEMIAVNRKKPNLAQHFKHDAKYVKKHNIKCTFSSETERHKQTKIILNRIKKIKVPPLYKYPPQNSDLPPILLQKSKIIEAAYTKAELKFYETDDGEVKYYDKKTENKHYLIEPDVTFFNEKNEPILFIEIKATHEVDFEKINKIRTLGINTIEIVIPKSSIREIEHRLLTNTRTTKWIYNNEEAITKYIPNSFRSGETIPLLDKKQRDIFAGRWTYECRLSQVKNLISEIEYHLGTELYANIEKGFRDEISRVEKNTERENELQREIQEEVDKEFRSRREKIEAGEAELQSNRKRLEELERGYTTKKKELETGQAEVERITREFNTDEETERIEGKIEEMERLIRNEQIDGEELRRKLEKIKNRDGSGTEKLSREIKDTIYKWGIIRDWESEDTIRNKYEEASRSLTKKDYKTWT